MPRCARAALIGGGAANDYGHPRAETLAFLKVAGPTALRTDQRELILLGLHDGELLVGSIRIRPPAECGIDSEEVLSSPIY